MKVFVIGSIPVQGDAAQYAKLDALLQSCMRRLGESLFRAGHELVICSPFAGSADLYVLNAFASAATGAEARSKIEMHYPGSPKVSSAVKSLCRSVAAVDIRPFPHASFGADDEVGLKYAWLLAQLTAMDASHAIVAVGGRLYGPMSLLLVLAEARNCLVLPFTTLGGAALEYHDKRQHALADLLKEDLGDLSQEAGFGRTAALLAKMTNSPTAAKRGQSSPRFFISYSWRRPADADYAEMMLRRRGYTVYRDDRSFEPGEEVEPEIQRAIRKADVFLALWCVEYACSPWCYDELELAIKLQKEQAIEIWLLCLDDTRIVPPGARSILTYAAQSRDQLTSALLSLLDRFDSKDEAE